MSRRVKLKAKDAAALEEFVERLRLVLRDNLVEVKLFVRRQPAKISLSRI